MKTDTPTPTPHRGKPAGRVLSAAALAAMLALAGCAANPNAVTRDPWEGFNRSVARFNEGVDAVVLKPAATVYRQAAPPLVRTGVSNFFGNLGDLWSAVNSAMQLKGHDALENFFRFNINTFFGLGGVLDIAGELHMERHKEDFGQTLGRWGVPTGPYVVVPIFGPSTLRDALSLTVDRQGNPITYVRDDAWRNGLYGLKAVNARANLLRASSVLDEAALDKYTFSRDVFLQYRRAEIYDGNPPDAGEPAAAAPAGAASAPAGPASAAPAAR